MAYVDYENLEPLSEIAQMDWFKASKTQLEEWARKRDKNSFPAPKETLGRYNFYDVDEVKKWYTLWTKVNRGNKELNNAKR